MGSVYDVAIIGLGAMGSAAAYHLASRGRRVLGLDRYSPPHTLGSSHGQTRIIREAYFEHPSYVPLIQRAYTLWDDLARAAEVPLFLQTGGLMIGSPESVVFRGARQSAEAHHLPHEVLSATEVRRRYPALQPDDTMTAVFEPRAGILFPERCVHAHLTLAARRGATLRADEPVLRWRALSDGLEITTTRDTYHADQMILAAGGWAKDLLGELRPSLAIERQVLFWFEPTANPGPMAFQPNRCPIHLWQVDDPEPHRFFYGFPNLGEGVKVAGHHGGVATDPDSVSREVTREEIEAMRQWLRRYLPGANGRFRSAAVCLYTNTTDEHFWIDRHPAHPRVLIASPCSGHGFKFASVIGEILADLATQGRSSFDLELFKNR